jgi:hypothetical protein
LPHRFEFRAGYRRAVRRWEVDLLRSQLVVDLVGDERVRPDQQTAPSERLARVVEDVDATIRQIRTSIFQLRGPLGPETSTTRKQLLAIAAESAGSIGFEPQIHFSGPVDSVVDDDVLEDLVAVLREALWHPTPRLGWPTSHGTPKQAAPMSASPWTRAKSR